MTGKLVQNRHCDFKITVENLRADSFVIAAIIGSVKDAYSFLETRFLYHRVLGHGKTVYTVLPWPFINKVIIS